MKSSKQPSQLTGRQARLHLDDILSSKAVLKHITDGFIVLSTAWTYLYINKEAEKLLKVKLTDVEGKQIWALFPNLKNTVFEREYRSVLKTQKPSEFTGYNDRVNKWFLVRALPIAEGIVVYFSDITDTYKAQTKLKEREELYRIVVDNSHDLINLLDRSGSFIYTNPSHKRILGYSNRALRGKNAFSLIHPKDVANAKAEFQKAVSEGFGQARIRFKHKKGHYVLLEGTGSRVHTDHTEPTTVVCVFRDITDAVEFDKRKDEFINMASHELNAPITSLMVYAKLLRKKISLTHNSDAIKFVGKMDSQVVRLRELTHDLLDLSRIQSGKMLYRKNRFSLKNLLTEVCDVMRETSDVHTTKLSIRDDAVISGDKNRISQVIINLLSNAYKYSPKDSNVLVSLEKRGKNAVISVKDFGAGISKEDQQKIFEQFYQISQNNGSHESGLGIGLHISSEIVAHHKGKIWVESKKGKGSTFFVSLPI